MSKPIEYKTSKGLVKLTFEDVKNYLVSGHSNYVTDQEVMMFMQICRYQGLNPWLREVYLIKYSPTQPATIVTGKDTFTKRAAALDICKGWKAGIIVETDGRIEKREGSFVQNGEKIIGGWADVFRKDWDNPLHIEVSYHEYEGKTKDGEPNRSWSQMPATMIRKVALVQALREAFSENFGGLYSEEEMSHIDIEGLLRKKGEVIDAESKPVQEEKEPSQEEKEPLATTKDIQKFHALLNELEKAAEQIGESIDKEKVKSKFKEACKVEHTNEMTKKQIEKCIAKLEKEIEKRLEKVAEKINQKAGKEELVIDTNPTDYVEKEGEESDVVISTEDEDERTD